MEIDYGSASVHDGIEKTNGSAAYGRFCKRKLDLLRVFSVRTDQLSIAAAHFASVAGDMSSVSAIAETKQEYEREKAETQEAYRMYSYHCREHGC